MPSSHINLEKLAEDLAFTWNTVRIAKVNEGELRLQTTFDGSSRVLLFRPAGNDRVLNGTGGKVGGYEGLRDCVEFFNEYLTARGL